MSEFETVRFPVRGMTCGSCRGRIMRTVGKVPGVAKVSVDLRRETATVRREPGVTDAQLSAAVAAAGYEADLAALEVLPPGREPGIAARVVARLQGARP